MSAETPAQKIKCLRTELAQARKALADEHEITLKWHRDNMVLAARNVELSKALEARNAD